MARLVELSFSEKPGALDEKPGVPAVEKSTYKKSRVYMNCLPFLGHKKWEAFYAYGS